MHAALLQRPYGVSAHLSYDHIDTDELGQRQQTPLEALWWRVIHALAPPTAFIAAASRHPRPLVTEYGVWADADNIARLRELQWLGASVWWFEADRAGAFAAWKRENQRAARAFDDDLWQRVVAKQDQHWPLLAALFGSNILRTV